MEADTLQNKDKEQDEERKLKNLLEVGLDSRGKMRTFVFGVAISIAFLAMPLMCIHMVGFRHGFFFNQTDRVDINFHGIAVKEGQILYMEPDLGVFVLLIMVKLFFFFAPPYSPSFTRLGWHTEGTMALINAMLAGMILAIVLGPKLVKDTLEVFFVCLRCNLLLAQSTLLTILQESVPRVSRGFATAIFCATETLLNGLCYLFVRTIYASNVVLNDTSELFEVVPWGELILLLLVSIALSKFLSELREAPYVYVNLSTWHMNWQRSRLGFTNKGRFDEKMAEWENLKVDSFKHYWDINIHKVSRETIDSIEEHCVTALRCEADGDQERKLIFKTVVVQLACCVLQLPVVILFANLNYLFQQLDSVSVDTACLWTHQMYVVFTISSVVALCVADLYPRITVVMLSATFSLLSLVGITYLHCTPVTSPTELRNTFALFLLVNGMFLIPTTWTVIGDICGKHRHSFLLFIMVINALIGKGAQAVFQLWGLLGFTLVVLPLNIVALVTFAALYTDETIYYVEGPENACHRASDHGNNGSDLGKPDNDHGDRGSDHAKAANDHGNQGTDHGNQGDAHGNPENDHGNQENYHVDRGQLFENDNQISSNDDNDSLDSDGFIVCDSEQCVD